MTKPAGFDEFWAKLRSEIAEGEVDWERTRRSQIVTSRDKSWRIDWVRFSSVGDTVIEGWLSVPEDHPANGAGYLWLPGYSYGTPPPDDSNLVAGTITFAINVHGNSPDSPYLNPAGKNDYILNGIESPSSYIYRAICAHCLLALEVLASQPEVTAKVGVGGMSQGGGLALIVAAQSIIPQICCADMPFLSDIRRSLIVSHSPAYRALQHALGHRPEYLETILLFDGLYHAPLITIPTWLSAGGKDPACKRETVEAVYETLGTANKRYMFFPNAGHVFTPEMNAAYQEMIENYLVQS